jgi:hypothetical protein
MFISAREIKNKGMLTWKNNDGRYNKYDDVYGKMMCEMKCMKMMMNNMMQMNVNMDKAMVSKMHECDEMMTSTMSMMKATKEKCC